MALEPGQRRGVTPRRRRSVRWIALGVALALVVVAIVAATRPSNQATSISSPLIGHRAPALAARDFAGQTISLRQDRGVVVVVNFFASWCPPCQAEEPNLARFAFEEHHQGLHVDLVSVDIDDSTAAARQFVQSSGISWPAVPDHAGQFASEFGVGSPPMTFFIDPSGTVVAALAGPATTDQLSEAASAAARV